MTRYYYDKYEVYRLYDWTLESSESPKEDFRTSKADVAYYTMERNEQTGKLSGSVANSESFYNELFVIINNDYLRFISELSGPIYYSSDLGTGELVITSRNIRTIETYTRSYTDHQGNFIETIIAEDGEYPDNSWAEIPDGTFWYVKRDTAETANILLPSGGERMHEDFTITWTKTSPDVLVDIDLSYNNGLNWEEFARRLAGNSYTHNFRNNLETSQARMRIRTVTDEGVGEWFENDGVFTISHDLPPDQPTHLQPKGITIDRTIPQVFSWKHYHANPQSKFDLEWSTDQQTWNRITRTTGKEEIIVESNTFPAGEVFWRVRTYSDAGIESTWSQRAFFTAGEPSNAPAITSSTDFTTARPTITWRQPDQITYQLVVRNPANEIVWDSGEVSSENRAVTIGTDLYNRTNYEINLRTQTELGLWTEFTAQMIHISFDPPARPTFELIPSDTFIAINISNPMPASNNIAVAYNDIYRDGERIATKVGRHYKDYTAVSGKEHLYQVVAVGENGGTNASQYQRATLRLKSSVLSNLNNDLVELVYNPTRNASNNKLGAKMFFAGRKKPVFQYEEHVENNLGLSFRVLSQRALDDFVALVEPRELLLYRDNRGRKIYGTIQNYNTDDNTNNVEWYEVSFTFEELDYSEVV